MIRNQMWKEKPKRREVTWRRRRGESDGRRRWRGRGEVKKKKKRKSIGTNDGSGDDVGDDTTIRPI